MGDTVKLLQQFWGEGCVSDWAEVGQAGQGREGGGEGGVVSVRLPAVCGVL